MTPDPNRQRDDDAIRDVVSTWDCEICNRSPRNVVHVCVNLPPLTGKAREAVNLDYALRDARAKLQRERDARIAVEAEATEWRATWHAELDGNAHIRAKHGALENETFPAFVDRLAAELAAAKAALLELDRLRPTGSPPSTGDPEVNARWIVDRTIEERNELRAALVVAERERDAAYRLGRQEELMSEGDPAGMAALIAERDAARSECAMLREALMDAVDCEIPTADGDVVAGLCASHRAEAQIALTNTAAAEKWQAELLAPYRAALEEVGFAGSLPEGALERRDAAVRAKALEEARTVWAVVYSTYADDEVAGLYRNKADAEARVADLRGMWEVAEWTVLASPAPTGERPSPPTSGEPNHECVCDDGVIGAESSTGDGGQWCDCPCHYENKTGRWREREPKPSLEDRP